MQLSYADPAAGLAGGLADSGFTDKVTGKNTAAAVEFGRYVCRGDADGRIKAPALATDVTDEKVLGGIVLRDGLVVNFGIAGNAAYAQNNAVPVLKRGRVWVICDGAVTAGTSGVFVRYAGTGVKGGIGGTSTGGETAALPRARWLTSAADGGLAQLEINL